MIHLSPEERDEFARMGLEICDQLMRKVVARGKYSTWHDDFRSRANYHIALSMDRLKNNDNIKAFLGRVIRNAFRDEYRYLHSAMYGRVDNQTNRDCSGLLETNGPDPQEMAECSEYWARYKAKEDEETTKRKKKKSMGWKWIREDDARVIMGIMDQNKDKTIRELARIIAEKTQWKFTHPRVCEFRKKWRERLCMTPS